MLIAPVRLRRFLGVDPHGVLHVGAHLAEEREVYRRAGFGRVLWVEAQSNLIPLIRESLLGSDDQIFEAAVWSETGVEKKFQITNNSQSSSLFQLAEHLTQYPDIVRSEERIVTTIRLDELIPSSEDFDFVTLDIQGAELEALKGLGERLAGVRWVFTEVNSRMMYEGIPLVEELDRYLQQFGLKRVVTVWNKAGWGDALYAKESPLLWKRVLVRIGVAVVLVEVALVEFWEVLRKKVRRMRRKVFRMIDRMRGL